MSYGGRGAPISGGAEDRKLPRLLHHDGLHQVPDYS